MVSSSPCDENNFEVNVALYTLGSEMLFPPMFEVLAIVARLGLPCDKPVDRPSSESLVGISYQILSEYLNQQAI